MTPQEIQQYFEHHDKLGRLLGIEITSTDLSEAVAKATVKEEHLNSANMAHGGLIFSLADIAFAVASNQYGRIAVGVQTSISNVKAAFEGDVLSAYVEEIVLGHKLSTYEVRIRNQNNELIALFTGTAYRKSEMLPVS